MRIGIPQVQACGGTPQTVAAAFEYLRKAIEE
jgi:hypothetical protein